MLNGFFVGEVVVTRLAIGLAALITASCLNATVVTAAQGVVVAYPSGCDYYIVETNTGYVLLEWYGGGDPNEGDKLVGDFESYGMKTIFNVTRDAETTVWVEDYMLGIDGVREQYYEHCN